jgi:hypothetical protein
MVQRWLDEFKRKYTSIEKENYGQCNCFSRIVRQLKAAESPKNQSTKIGKPKRLARKVVLFLI